MAFGVSGNEGWEEGFCDGLLWVWQTVGGIQSVGRDTEDALVESVLYLMELLKIFIR